ncbi:ABC transporter permease domain protein [Rickettsia endosymbiont of Ixodes pacificus]|nr:ABC transporter permease domain protein [Rickettsia endosymbiont of Ixodes pacificus]
MSIVITALEQSLIMLPLILGMYISYRVLKITDLTVDGTYVLGAAVFARSL